MDLYVFDTTTSHRFWISVTFNDTVQQLKQTISLKLNVSPHLLRLTFRNKPLLKDHLTVSDYNITRNAELHVHQVLDDPHSDIPLALRVKELTELHHMCCDLNIDLETQLHCATLIGYAGGDGQLTKALCKQASQDPRRLQVLFRLAENDRRFYELTEVEILNPFCDPCQHHQTLNIVSKMVRKKCEVIGRKESISFSDTILHQLNLLIMYSGHEAIVANAIEAYNTLMGETCDSSHMTQIIQQSGDTQKTLECQYVAKVEQERVLFEGFMHNIQSIHNVIIHEHVDGLMSKYYHCYKDESHKYDLIQRLMDIANIGSGYSKKTRHLALLMMYKVTRFCDKQTLMKIMYNYNLLLTVRMVLEQFEPNMDVMRVIGVMLYNCVNADVYCLFNYDVLEPLVKMFVGAGQDNQEPVVYILNTIKDKIPKGKLLYLMNTYPLVQNICMFSTYGLVEKEATKQALQIIAHILGMEQRDISGCCVSIINNMSSENVLKQVPSLDAEMNSMVNSIIAQYFSQ